MTLNSALTFHRLSGIHLTSNTLHVSYAHNFSILFTERVSPSNSSNEIRFGGPQLRNKMSRENSGTGNQPSTPASISERRMAKYKEERRRQLASQIANRLSSNHGSSSSDENEDSNASSLEKYAKYRRHHR